MKPFKCPLCRQTVSEVLFEKITGVWRERRIAEKKFKEQEKRLFAQKRKMIQRLKVERRKLLQEQRDRVRHEVEGQIRKYSVKLEHLKTEKGRMRESFDRRVASAVRLAESRARATIHQELKGKMMETIQKQVAKVSAQTQRNLFRAQQTIESTHKQMSSLKGKSLKQQQQNLKLQQHIDNLERQLKNQTTPQLEGLLYEDNLLQALRKEFPEDKFEHPGKSGDLLHFILNDGERVGIIVYECKKVLHWNSAHLEQTAQAKLQRKADYAVLVTNAQKKGSGGISVERGVVIVGPGGAIAMAGILRGQIMRIAELKLTKAQREDAIEKTLEYVQGPEFKNALEVVIRKTKEMYDDLKKECQDHAKTWRKRYDLLKTVYLNSSQVHEKTAALIAGEIAPKRRAISAHLFPALPALTKS